MTQTTIFRNFTQKVENQSIEFVLNQIKSDKYKTEVEKVRVTYEKDGKEASDLLKKKLLAFTPSGTFDNGRKAELVTTYTNLVVLDFDNLSDADFKAIKLEAPIIPYSHASFVSPSGNGFKILVKVDCTVENHLAAIKQVSEYYEQAFCTVIDPTGKDVSRLCFMSYDPDLYYKQESMVFHVNIEKQETIPFSDTLKKDLPPIQNPIPENTDWQQQFEKAIAWTEKNYTYLNGNRNNYIHLLACNCNRLGISENSALEYIMDNFDLGTNEIKSTVHSAYQNNASEFASFANIVNGAKLQSLNDNDPFLLPNEEIQFDFLKNSKIIPNHVYTKLPKILNNGARVFEDVRKKDVFLTGALAIISGILPNVTGVYHQERVYPHLYSFIIGPPASGKGVLKNAKRLADKYHQKILAQSREDQKNYEVELIEYKEQLRNQKKGDAKSLTPPEKKPFKIVFIPADCSHARMIEHLQNNGGQGIICETEADTMSGSKKQDWGDYSPTLRSAFHHEKITFTRKTNNEYIEIDEPRLAVTLSGTPAQAPRLIASAEDGLFSRFIFYAFKSDIIWQDPSPINKTVVFNDHFENLSIEVSHLIEFLERYPTQIHLSELQWNKLNNSFSQFLFEITTFTSEDAAGVVYRLGLILFRICMIFTTLRKFEGGDTNVNCECTDEDFGNALEIIKVYLSHSILMFNNLPQQSSIVEFKNGDNKLKFFEALPNEFSRKEAVEIGTTYNLSTRLVDNLLKTTLGKLLKKLKTGCYVKI